MSHEVIIHDAQTAIIRALLFSPSLRFSKLQKETGLESKHANFHIKRLLELGYVQKLNSGEYALTPHGKEHANKLDTDTNTVEKQPKVSIVILAERQDAERRELLCQQRLKNPFFGYWGRLGGKVRWGESFVEVAKRELLEETGLMADFEFKTLYRKRDYITDGSRLLEDKLFILMQASNISGDLVEEFEGGKNAWLTSKEFEAKNKYFASAAEFQTLADTAVPYVERDFFSALSEY